MPILAWFVVGLIGGIIGSFIVNKRGEGIVGDLVLGVIGAVAGGWAFSEFGQSSLIGLNLPGVLVSPAGAMAALTAYHAVRGAGVSS